MITLVVPAHNPRSDELERSLGSIRRVLPMAQIIVVDDGSAPPAAVLGADLVARTPGVGPGAARNAGAALAEHPWLIFLDDDDELLPGAVEFLAVQAPGAATVGLVCAGAESHRGGTITVDVPKPVTGLSADVRLSSIAGSFMVSKAVFDSVGGYDTELRFGENTDLIIRCAAASDVLAIDSPTIRYHAQATERRYDQRRLDAAERVLKRGRADLRHPRAKSNLHGIACVNAARTGQYRRAISHAWRSLAAFPRPASMLRLTLALLGPLGRKWWSR